MFKFVCLYILQLLHVGGECPTYSEAINSIRDSDKVKENELRNKVSDISADSQCLGNCHCSFYWDVYSFFLCIWTLVIWFWFYFFNLYFCIWVQ